jgi:hypothetical protein
VQRAQIFLGQHFSSRAARKVGLAQHQEDVISDGQGVVRMMGGHKHGQAVIVRQASDPVDSGPSLSVQKVNSLQIGFRRVQNTPECELDIATVSPRSR